MKLIYDEKLMIEQYDDNYYIAYSPFNHTFAKVSEAMKRLIQYILNHSGEIGIDDCIYYFKDYSMDVVAEEIQKQIQALVEAKLFFYDQESYKEEEDLTVRDYQFPSTQQIEMVYIHPTLKCNYDCSYCYNKLLAANQKELSTKQWIDIIQDLKTKNVKYFIFTGGEPLLRKDLIDIIRETKDEDTRVEILSNGSLLMNKVDQLLPLVDSFVVSLDSLDLKLNAKNRSEIGFQNIIKLIEYFSEVAPKKLKIRSVVTKENADTIQKFNQEIEDKYGIQCVNVRFIPNNKKELSLMPETPEPYIDMTKKYKIDLGIKKYRCGACSNIMAINPEGDIYPCQSLMSPEFKIANVLDDNWQDIVSHSKITSQFRNIKVNDMDKCKGCEYRYICGGGCPAVSYKVYGDLNKHLSFFCDYLKKESQFKLKLAKFEQ